MTSKKILSHFQRRRVDELLPSQVADGLAAVSSVFTAFTSFQHNNFHSWAFFSDLDSSERKQHPWLQGGELFLTISFSGE